MTDSPPRRELLTGYPMNHHRDPPLAVYAFDTDQTVRVPRGGVPGPVPFEHILDLKANPTVSVWATGYNQSLRRTAGIPGMRELKTILSVDADFIDRADRPRLLEALFPDVERRIIVDDVDLSRLEPTWEYYPPAVYVRDELNHTPPRDD